MVLEIIIMNILTLHVMTVKNALNLKRMGTTGGDDDPLLER